MPLLSNNALDKLRRVSNLHLPDTVSILVPTKTNTGTGQTITYAAAATAVPCRRIPLSRLMAQEMLSRGTIKSLEVFNFRFSHDQAFETLDGDPVGTFRLQDSDGTYEVIPTPQGASLRVKKQYTAYKIG